MNIVHQLRSGGDAEMDDVYVGPVDRVRPPTDSDRGALIAAIDDLPGDRRRAFKTHSAPGELQCFAAGDETAVSHVGDPARTTASPDMLGTIHAIGREVLHDDAFRWCREGGHVHGGSS